MHDLIEKALKKVDEAELMHQGGKSRRYYAAGDEERISTYTESDSYALRIIKDGRIGFSFFKNVNEFDKALDYAQKTSKFVEKLDVSFPGKGQPKKMKGVFDSKLLEKDDSEFIDILNNSIGGFEGSKVKHSETEISVRNLVQHLINSNGFENKTDETYYDIEISGNIGDSSEWENRSEHSFFESEDIPGKVIERTIFMDGAKPLTGEYEILFEHSYVKNLLSKFILTDISGPFLYDKRSPLLEKLGEKIASDGINIEEDPFMDGGYSSYSYDDEGVPCNKKYLIEDGVLKTFLYDLKYAKKCSTDPTGNGFRSEGNLPYPQTTNVTAKSNERDKIENFNGISMKRTLTLHPNQETSEFSTSVMSAILMKDGENAQAIRGCQITGNFYEMLKESRLADNDGTYTNYYGPSWIMKAKLV